MNTTLVNLETTRGQLRRFGVDQHLTERLNIRKLKSIHFVPISLTFVAIPFYITDTGFSQINPTLVPPLIVAFRWPNRSNSEAARG